VNTHSGALTFQGLKGAALGKKQRSRTNQMVFQTLTPPSNPRKTFAKLRSQSLLIHGRGTPSGNVIPGQKNLAQVRASEGRFIMTRIPPVYPSCGQRSASASPELWHFKPPHHRATSGLCPSSVSCAGPSVGFVRLERLQQQNYRLSYLHSFLRYGVVGTNCAIASRHVSRAPFTEAAAASKMHGQPMPTAIRNGPARCGVHSGADR